MKVILTNLEKQVLDKVKTTHSKKQIDSIEIVLTEDSTFGNIVIWGVKVNGEYTDGKLER